MLKKENRLLSLLKGSTADKRGNGKSRKLTTICGKALLLFKHFKGTTNRKFFKNRNFHRGTLNSYFTALDKIGMRKFTLRHEITIF